MRYIEGGALSIVRSPQRYRDSQALATAGHRPSNAMSNSHAPAAIRLQAREWHTWVPRIKAVGALNVSLPLVLDGVLALARNKQVSQITLSQHRQFFDAVTERQTWIESLERS